MTDTKELHYRYNLVYGGIFLLSVIVVLLSVKWGAIQGLVEYISFGLTLTSLFLALIAIIYAIISNTTFSQHLGTLQSATQGVVDAAGSLSKVTASLESKVGEIPVLIRNVESKLDEARKEIKERTLQQEAASPDAMTKEEPPKGIDPAAFISFFLERSSFNGLLALYTAQLAHATKKPFDIGKVWAGTSLSADYGLGYLVACTSTGMVNHTAKDSMWSITFWAAEMPDIRPKLTAWLQERAKEKPDMWNVDNETATMIAPIEAYFRD